MSFIPHQGRTQRAPQKGLRKSAAVILLVDDYEDSRLMLRKLLEMSGYVVLEAANGVEAVNLTRQKQPDLVLMDVGLPLLSGIEAMKQIRETPETSAIQIIFLSAYDAASARDGAIAAGGDGYLTKPVDFEKLENTIRTLLARASNGA